MTCKLEEQRFVRELAWTWTISRLTREIFFSRNVKTYGHNEKKFVVVILTNSSLRNKPIESKVNFLVILPIYIVDRQIPRCNQFHASTNRI